MTSFNNTKSLEISSPILLDESRVGTLYLRYSLSFMEPVVQTMLFVVGGMLAIVLYFVYRDFIKDEKSQQELYDADIHGIHNRKYLDQYIDDHYEEITNGSYLFGLVNINNYDNLKITMEVDVFNETVLAYKNEIRILINSASQIFEYDEISLVLLYNLYLNDDELVDQHQVYTSKKIQNNVDFDDIHFASKTGVIRLNKAFASPYITKSNIDNAISFLKKDAENSFPIFGNELWDKLI